MEPNIGDLSLALEDLAPGFLCRFIFSLVAPRSARLGSHMDLRTARCGIAAAFRKVNRERRT